MNWLDKISLKTKKLEADDPELKKLSLERDEKAAKIKNDSAELAEMELDVEKRKVEITQDAFENSPEQKRLRKAEEDYFKIARESAENAVMMALMVKDYKSRHKKLLNEYEDVINVFAPKLGEHDLSWLFLHPKIHLKDIREHVALKEKQAKIDADARRLAKKEKEDLKNRTLETPPKPTDNTNKAAGFYGVQDGEGYE
ncbi:hypothetical protein ACFL6K_01280 [Candidatus Latescibacterota bacterium]